MHLDPSIRSLPNLDRFGLAWLIGYLLLAHYQKYAIYEEIATQPRRPRGPPKANYIFFHGNLQLQLIFFFFPSHEAAIHHNVALYHGLCLGGDDT